MVVPGSILALISTIIGAITFGGAPTRGEHVGIVTAVETSGIFWQTHSVYVKTDAESTQEDVYCVTDASLLEPLRNLSKTREHVTLRFHRPGVWVGPWDCGGQSAIVYEVVSSG